MEFEYIVYAIVIFNNFVITTNKEISHFLNFICKRLMLDIWSSNYIISNNNCQFKSIINFF